MAPTLDTTPATTTSSNARPSQSVMASSLLAGSLTAEPPLRRRDVFCNPRRTLRAVSAEFREHQSRLKLFSATQSNYRWPEVFGTSPWFQPQSPALLIFRLLASTTFVAMCIWSIAVSWDDGFWVIYLTHWSLTVETVYFLFATYTTFAAWLLIHDIDANRRSSEVHKLPWFVRVTWVLNHIEMPASFLVMSLKWTLLTPFWKLTQAPPFLDMFVHGINFIICFSDLLLGRNAFYLPHVLWFYAYTTLYFLWTLVHFALRIGSYTSCFIDGVEYPKDECPIYVPLDWHKPTVTGVLAVFTFLFVIPLVQFPIWWCVRSRRTADYFRRANEQGGRTPAQHADNGGQQVTSPLDATSERANSIGMI